MTTITPRVEAALLRHLHPRQHPQVEAPPQLPLLLPQAVAPEVLLQLRAKAMVTRPPKSQCARPAFAHARRARMPTARQLS